MPALIPLEQYEPLPPVSEEGKQLLADLEAFLTAYAEESPDVPTGPTGTFGLVIGGVIQPCGHDYWRGALVCDHMVPKLNAWAQAVGNDIYLKPLPGCGSYQTTTAASAGTHSKGGAIDIDTRGFTTEQRTRIMNVGRRWFEVDWQRDAITGLWTWHNHAIDASCPNLASQAAAQVVMYRDGLNGLANRGRDTGTRLYVADTWDRYLKRASTTVASVAADILSIAGEAIDSVEDEDMPLNDADKAFIQSAAASAAKAAVESFFADPKSAQLLFQTHAVFRDYGSTNPDRRVAASYLMERSNLDRLIDRTGDSDVSALQELASTLTQVQATAAELKTVSGLTYEQDDILRKLYTNVETLLGKATGA